VEQYGIFEVLEVSINTRSSFDGSVPNVDHFGDSIRESKRTLGYKAVLCRIPENLMAALAFHFSASHFSALACHCRNKKTDWQKNEGQKDSRHLWIHPPSTPNLFFAT
jgi:hypothetical protein